MNNKMGAFKTSIKNFKESYARIPKNPDPQLMHEWRAKMDLEVQRISAIQDNLSRLVQSYARQAEGKYESVDVNKVVEDVALELERTAERKTTEIVFDLSARLPEAWAIRSQLQQIVLNIALNAIQMINLQCELGRMLEQQTNHYIPALQKGMIIIQTRYAGEKAAFPIEVRVIDNGPGVHWRDQERIFFAGVTRRGGAGLGLYISRNLVERMGGRLDILDSSLFMGSVFSLELRPYTAFEEKK
jgi:signal transduction histidine kinase